jgi:DNA mismatch repair protein MutS
MNDLTPLMRQYQEIKQKHPTAILFFRVGDFYEMFYDDAVEASKILSIALTSRDKSKENAVPLCGVPYHAASGYIAKLIRAGRTVAICEQAEDPETARSTHGGPVRREVVKVITPGTLIEPELLNSKENNYLAAVCAAENRFGLAVADLSTGEFKAGEFDHEHHLFLELDRIEPKELLMTEALAKHLEPRCSAQGSSPRICIQTEQAFAPVLAEKLLLDHFGVRTLEGFGLRDHPLAVAAAGALVRYLQETQRRSLSHLTRLSVFPAADFLLMDPQTQRNLELTRRMNPPGPIESDRTDGTLLSVLDRTLTPMGGRLLRQWLVKPLAQAEPIHRRLDAVQEGVEDLEFRMKLRSLNKKIGDLERLIGRIALAAAPPRDLVALAQSVAPFPEIRKLLSNRSSSVLQEMSAQWDDLTDLQQRINAVLVEDPPPMWKEGGIIRDGYDPAVDELRTVQQEAGSLLAALEAEERRRTGIESLKVRYNQVFGYFIEVTKTHLHRVPEDYQRKQTLTQAERFVTPKLIELEDRILGASERLKARENQLFEELRIEIAKHTARVQAMASAIAHLDVLSTLSEAAAALHYTRPTVTDGPVLKILEGRHPILEHRGTERFIPNDTYLDSEDHRLLIITGPNMAGKSTYMRQVALIVILAQMGSFVPAREAEIGLVDRIFTRVGASDNLIEGQSTFMVEMVETANLLHNATAKSLVLLDEIGRGTSTFDGLSIAWAVAEHLHEVGCRALFATHYHQLTELAMTHRGVKNYNIAVREWNDEIIFLRKIVEGATDRSYGIQVARLAGLPREVVERAKEILANLESGELNELGQPRIAAHSAGESGENTAGQLDLLSSASGSGEIHPVLRDLRELDVLRLTPLEALNRLNELKKKADDLNPQSLSDPDPKDSP